MPTTEKQNIADQLHDMNSADLKKLSPDERKKILEAMGNHLNEIDQDNKVTKTEREKARDLLVQIRKLDLDEMGQMEVIKKDTGLDLTELSGDIARFSQFESGNVVVEGGSKDKVLGAFENQELKKAFPNVSAQRLMIEAQKGYDLINSDGNMAPRYDLAIGPKLMGASEDPKKYIQAYRDYVKGGNSTASGGTSLGIKPEGGEVETEAETEKKTPEEVKAESLAKIDTLVTAHTGKLGDNTADFIKTKLIDGKSGELSENAYNKLGDLLKLPAEAWNGYKLSSGDVARLVDPETRGIDLLTNEITWDETKQLVMVSGTSPFRGIKELFDAVQKDKMTVPDNVDLKTNTQDDMDNKKTKEKVDSVNAELLSIKTDFPWSKFDFSVGQDGDSAIIKRDDSSETITRDGNYFLINYGNGDKSAAFTLKQAAVIANLLNFTRVFLNDGNKKVENDSEPFVRYGTGIDFAVDDHFDTGFIGDGSKWQTYYEKQGLSRDQIMGILNTWYHNSYEKKSS